MPPKRDPNPDPAPPPATIKLPNTDGKTPAENLAALSEKNYAENLATLRRMDLSPRGISGHIDALSQVLDVLKRKTDGLDGLSCRIRKLEGIVGR
jgi:hypothetical protein